MRYKTVYFKVKVVDNDKNVVDCNICEPINNEYRVNKLQDENDFSCFKITGLYKTSSVKFMLLAKQTIEWKIFLLDNTNINVLLQYKIDYVKQFKENNKMIETIHNKHIERLRKINDNKIDDQYQLVELETKHRNLTKKYNFLNNDYQNIELQLTDYSNRLSEKIKK